jgi:ectoine hydroxylase-related dioxygenase (phytanoyl-CoA dioxygenase family)
MDAGDLVIFNGRFIHKSLENLSEKSRYAYTWHLFDRGVSKWD